MQIDFHEKQIRCLQERISEVIYQEETAEIIVPDIYPDAAEVAEVTAVCCVRDRELRQGSLSVAGAFQTTVIFSAEETGEVCVQEVWMPFSVKLSAEDAGEGCVGFAEVRVRSADARILNSRKLLVRVSYAARLSAYAPSMLCSRRAESEGKVRFLRSEQLHYAPLCGAEKRMTFSEQIRLPDFSAPVRRIARVRPELTALEQRMDDGKVIWKGELELSVLCLLESGRLAQTEVRIPVAQYLETEETDSEVEPQTVCLMTEFRVEEDASGTYLVSAGILFQTLLWGSVPISAVRDGYAIGKTMTAEYETLRICGEHSEETRAEAAELPLRGELREPLDSTLWVDFPVCRKEDGAIAVGTSVTLQALYYDESGALRGELIRGEVQSEFPLEPNALCYADASLDGEFHLRRETRQGSGAVLFCLRKMRETEQSVMRSAQIEEREEGSAGGERPSLTARRIREGEPLWNIAKEHETTVEALCEVNGLEDGDAAPDTVLLIPAYTE